MKKKLTAIFLCVALVAIAVVGASLAYFTDTDNETNTFAVGNVKIELIEQQRKVENGEKTTTLEDFENNKVLMPIVGSAQGDKDEIGMPVAKNYVDKMITVKNTGNSSAYVRVYMAVPKALEDKNNAAGNFTNSILHVNYDITERSKNWDKEVFVGTQTIDGVVHNVYYRQYNVVLEKDTVTEGRAYEGLYLDKRVDMKDGKYTMEGIEISGYDLSKGVNIPVYAVAVQSEGFENATAAFTAAFDAGYTPWGNVE